MAGPDRPACLTSRQAIPRGAEKPYLPSVPPAPPLRLTRLLLHDFRSYAEASWPVSGRIVLVSGENGAGKTNLLEAISLLAPGRGLRGARVAELARHDPAGGAAWAVAGRFEGPGGESEIGTGTPPAGTSGGGSPGNAPDRRVFRLDGNPVRSQAELAERVAMVWLTPQMDRLFQEGLSGRRRFLDRLVWALEPGHAREVAAHDQAMSQRNRLLAERRGDNAWLAALEDAMARHGVAATAARRAVVAQLNALLEGGVVGAFPAARLGLACGIAEALDREPALAVEDRLRADLALARPRDAAAGAALSGAHRCDMLLTHAGKGVPASLCSTGEQKALLVAMVLAHAALMGTQRGFAPLLLLDEIAAHLDAARREALFAALSALPAQAFLTGTDPALFAPLAGLAEGFRVEGGKVVPDPHFPVPKAA
ncbi:DNA replication/repair protein RecF [Roseomonas sp. NAR14]|uniref:DNA replication and repair protein RecF n=1 Tax=Roseomonas acroporae TaxID=2937791 RepID=A0A9X1Y738_9PROT|nr:DNA replication/repair protein RecF [Roseomonas acroporae]MCK8783425.1 DNA replication/repair protein RecF [Roseomonas acroporae]